MRYKANIVQIVSPTHLLVYLRNESPLLSISEWGRKTICEAKLNFHVVIIKTILSKHSAFTSFCTPVRSHMNVLTVLCHRNAIHRQFELKKYQGNKIKIQILAWLSRIKNNNVYMICNAKWQSSNCNLCREALSNSATLVPHWSSPSRSIRWSWLLVV